jgi:hypothetical protein
MNDRNLTALVATILTALASGGGEGREGPMYAVMMGVCSLDDFQATLSVLRRLGFVIRDRNFLVRITDSGRAMAQKIEALLAAKGAAVPK